LRSGRFARSASDDDGGAVLRSGAELYLAMLQRLVQASARYAGWVLALAVLVTAVLVHYTATHLILDTHPDRLLDPRLPYLQTERELKRAFPHLGDSVLIVVDGESAAVAGDAASRLIQRLRQEQGLVHAVYAPEASEFFKRHGLLYLDEAELVDLGDRLTDAAPFLGALAQDPSLRGLFNVLAQAVEVETSPAYQSQLQSLLAEIAATIEAQLAGRERRIAWDEGLLGGTQIGVDTRQRFVLVRPHLDFESLHPAHDALLAMRSIVRAEEQAQPGVRFRLTGDVPMEAEELESVSRGMGLATVLALILVCALLVVGFRALRVVIAVLATLLVGLAWSAAFATLAIGHLNLISVAFAVLFVGLGVDFGIQFAMRYREELDDLKHHSRALAHTITGVGGALTLAATAAAVGFFSFTPTRYWGLAELGMIAGASMFLGLLANLTVLPALLTLLPVQPRRPAREGRSRATAHALIGRARRPILLAAVLAGIGSLLLAPQARFDFNPLNMRDPTTESVATFIELLLDPDTTPYTGQILAENLDAARVLASWLEKLPAVDHTVTLASFVPQDQDAKLSYLEDLRLVLTPLVISPADAAPPHVGEELKAYVRLRESLHRASAGEAGRAHAEGMLALAHAMERLQSAPGWPDPALPELRRRIVSDLPQRLDQLRSMLTPERVTLADLPPELVTLYIASDGRARVEVFPADDMTDNVALRRFVRQVQGVVPQAGGAPIALLEGGDAVIRASLQAAVLASIAALVLLLVVLRSVGDVVLILVPMAFAALLTTAASVLFDLPFNLANIIALPLLLAMTVAFGIYIVMRRRTAADVGDLFDSSTPRAVLFSALTTAVAFGSMTFSDHLGMASMGQLLALSLAFALLSTLVVLPALMAQLERERAP
jgi:uncharacterized protein